MAVFESLTRVLRALMIGEKVKVTLRPETGRLFPLEGRILKKDDESGIFSVQLESGVVEIKATDVLSITRMER